MPETEAPAQKRTLISMNCVHCNYGVGCAIIYNWRCLYYDAGRAAMPWAHGSMFQGFWLDTDRKGTFMKKRSIWRIAALILCIAMAMGIVILRNRKETVTVQEKYHERDAACDASFMMWSMERDGIEYGFDQKGFTKEEAISYMLEVEESVTTIRTQMKDVDSFPQDGLKKPPPSFP